MLQKIMCAAVVVVFAWGGVAFADEFQASVTKVDSGKITFKKGTAQKPGEEMTLPASATAAVTQGKLNTDSRKVEVDEPLASGLSNEQFMKIGENGLRVTITTDAGNKQIIAIRVAASPKDKTGQESEAIFTLDSAAYSGQFDDYPGTGFGGTCCRRFTGIDSSAEMVVTGTALTIDCQSWGPAIVEAQVDGGKWADITPAATAPAIMTTSATVFSGLADAPHVVTIRARQPVFFYLNCSRGGCFKVTGKAPDVSPPAAAGIQYVLNAKAPDILGRPGILDHIRLEGGYGPAQLRHYDLVQPMMQALGSGNGYLQYNFGARFRFQATIRELAVWTYLDDSKYALVVDGAVQTPVQTPALDRWGWLTLATELDQSAAHEYAVLTAFFLPLQYYAGSGSVYALRTRGGSGVDSKNQPAVRPLLACYGDSITANTTSFQTANPMHDPQYHDFTRGWMFLLGQTTGMATVNLGIGSTTVHDFGANVGTVAAAGREYITTDTGAARTRNITDLDPHPSRVIILYGTNDLGQAWKPSGAPVESLQEFKASYQAMLAKIMADLPAPAQAYCVGILPRSDITAAEIAPWNDAIKMSVAVPGHARVHFIDPVPWKLNGDSGTDYKTNFMDGLHPSAAGCAIIAEQIQKAIASIDKNKNNK